jgi:hypothetical protein
MKAPGRPAHARLSPLTLLAALSALITLALVGSLIFILVHARQPGAPSPTIAAGKFITTAQTASGVRSDGSPLDSVTSFSVGQKVYIVYTVTDAGPGTATIKLYDNGVFVDSMSQQFQRRSSYNGYFTFPATKAGDWEADLYWQTRGTPGDGSLEQRVTFQVGDASTQSARPFQGWLVLWHTSQQA